MVSCDWCREQPAVAGGRGPGPERQQLRVHGHQHRQHSDRGTDVVENILNRFDDVEAEYADVLLYDEFDD